MGADNIADHGGDPDLLTVSGHSAGAHLATMLFDGDERPSGIKARCCSAAFTT